MLFGGVNGDGFFNEEYDYDLSYGSEYDGGYESPVSFDKYSLKKTGVETEKAIQFKFKGFGNIWLPKVALTTPHFSSINAGAEGLVIKNIKELIKSMKEK